MYGEEQGGKGMWEACVCRGVGCNGGEGFLKGRECEDWKANDFIWRVFNGIIEVRGCVMLDGWQCG